MCLAIPCKVTELRENNEMATVQVGGEGDTFVDCSLMLLPEAPQIGDYVLIHAGFAINAISTEDALETLRIIKEMAELTGQMPVGNTAFDL